MKVGGKDKPFFHCCYSALGPLKEILIAESSQCRTEMKWDSADSFNTKVSLFGVQNSGRSQCDWKFP
ncbi:hypothetical protein LEMLEM_LOCUS24813 [Lemmus lemmus]